MTGLLKTAFVDRDGVINRTMIREGRPFAPALAEDVEILPCVHEALERLRAAGYYIAVVTNQPDIARGTTTWEQVNAIHAMLRTRLGLEDIRVCPHDDADDCDCRKPKPGLLLREPHADMATSVMVGDRWRDIEAGRAAGCAVTILVDYGYDEPMPHEPTVRVASLADAVSWLLNPHA